MAALVLSPSMTDDPPSGRGPVALGEVLRAVGREVADLGRLASDLQTVLSPATPWSAQDAAALDRLQSLDALTQGLHGVSDFLRALAAAMPEQWSCDAARAAETLTLSGLAHRLGRPVRPAAPTERAVAGEFELFEV